MGNQIILLTFYFLLGTAVGSFLNVWSRRLLRGKPPTGRSRCEHCKHVLSALDLIPLASFFLLRGRCRYCKKPLSWQYPIVELATGLLFVALSPIVNQPFGLISYGLLMTSISALIVVFITDFSAQVIFDQTIWAAVIGALLYRISLLTTNYSLFSILYDLLGALGVYLSLRAVRLVTKKRGMGEGDPPLGFVTALLVGFPAMLVELFAAFVIGGITGSILVLGGKKHLKDRIAFGPFLVVATFATLFWGEGIWRWYLSVLGL
ncbi:hypothetical protein A2890_02225 [candidate division WWE3 bacterium RIFCSPLOWO2_01_FULL_53_14]|uniref:Peptidase A24A N-terminal domain-containing protein n=1 Tax=candidate division WWE3 bacterium RIFCSPLOWO2_01_FULL_53_14 TaxID=1802628 RepID=A0A1F4VW81_UNCKA|nr:MAG: hypothetical protein A2890_02225 [candidate division WWE3 bacterium RIFCSPLOWO2_01_FULL_53_14]